MTTTFQELIASLLDSWSIPRFTSDTDPHAPDFEVACSFDGPVSRLPQADLPPDLVDFWSVCARARLFEDRKYGQWGLAILSPEESVERTGCFREQRQRDYVPGDSIVGEFLGDSDLLIVRCDPDASDFGQTIVALQLDIRADWDPVGSTFLEFVQRYVAAEGNKFWEFGSIVGTTAT